MSRASESLAATSRVLSSIANAAFITPGNARNATSFLANSASDIRPISLAAFSANNASVVNWQVKALVDATPISVPAKIGIARSLSRAIELSGTFTTDKILSALPDI